MHEEGREINSPLSGGFSLSRSQQQERAKRFVDDGANYENANHNVTKMEAI